jgi:Family of unknown function (DUF5670)
MSLLGVVLTLVVVGVLLWLLNNYVPMDSKIKSIANVVVAKGRGVGREKESVMLWTVAVILLALWALGMGTAYSGGGLVHVLLVIAAIVVVFQFLGGRRTV